MYWDMVDQKDDISVDGKIDKIDNEGKLQILIKKMRKVNSNCVPNFKNNFDSLHKASCINQLLSLQTIQVLVGISLGQKVKN